MPGLLDIAPSQESVTVGDVSVPVTGISAKGVVTILSRFPVVRELMTGRTPKLDGAAIMEMVPEAIGALIAAGTGNPGSAEHEAVANALGVEAQLDFLEAIIRATLPKGPGPFVARLMALASVVGVESMNIPGMKSPSPSNT